MSSQGIFFSAPKAQILGKASERQSSWAELVALPALELLPLKVAFTMHEELESFSSLGYSRRNVMGQEQGSE